MLEVVTFGVGFSLVFATAQLCRKDPGLSNVLNFLVYLGNGIIQLMVVLKVRNVIPEHPMAAFLFLSSIFFVGPANYLYHYLLLNPGKDLPVKLKLQFAPAAAVFLCEVIFQLLPVGTKQRFLAELLSSPLEHWFTIVLAAGAVFSFAYFLILLRLGFTVLKSESIRKQVLILLAAFVFTLVSIILLSLGFLLGSDQAILLGGMTITVIIVCVFLSTMRYPNFYRIIENEIKKNRYERSLLKGLDTEIIYDRLTYLMDVEDIYKDFDLSLESLAEMMSLSPHQLSQFMNERLNTNFRNYINKYRIDAAKRILVADPGKNILTICYDVGFNSKSTFNLCFKKYTNRTPSEFRQEHLAGGTEGPDL